MPELVSRKDPDTIYRSRPALKQRKFPSQQRRVRHTGSGPPRLHAQQSTLTQLDFCTPRTKDDIEITDSDGEYQERRVKKPRRSGPSRRQSTLTQLDFGTPRGLIFEDDELDEISGVDGPSDERLPNRAPQDVKSAMWDQENIEERGLKLEKEASQELILSLIHI